MCVLKQVNECDIYWAKGFNYNIVVNDTVVGYIKIFNFSKESIFEEIGEDYAYYMDEDTHMKEPTAQFILDNLSDKQCVYIDEIFILDEFRGRGYGSASIKNLQNIYPSCAFILRAGPLRNDVLKCFEDEKYFDIIKNKLNNFYTQLDFKNQQNIYFKNF